MVKQNEVKVKQAVRYRNYTFDSKAGTDEYFGLTSIVEYLDGCPQYMVYTYHCGRYQGFVQFKTTYESYIMELYMMRKDKLEFAPCNDAYTMIKNLKLYSHKFMECGTFIVPEKQTILMMRSSPGVSSSNILPKQKTLDKNGHIEAPLVKEIMSIRDLISCPTKKDGLPSNDVLRACPSTADNNKVKRSRAEGIKKHYNKKKKKPVLNKRTKKWEKEEIDSDNELNKY